MERKVPFTISGKVVGGNKLGRTIDIPTANIFPKEDVSKMAFGVYYSKVFIGGNVDAQVAVYLLDNVHQRRRNRNAIGN